MLRAIDSRAHVGTSVPSLTGPTGTAAVAIARTADTRTTWKAESDIMRNKLGEHYGGELYRHGCIGCSESGCDELEMRS
ncbi:hypothetical protein VTI28DRAFT_9309 [Corynascus sepedonium]